MSSGLTEEMLVGSVGDVSRSIPSTAVSSLPEPPGAEASVASLEARPRKVGGSVGVTSPRWTHSSSAARLTMIDLSYSSLSASI